jgi:glycosyltransferase involved in cell wall biosynthesis
MEEATCLNSSFASSTALQRKPRVLEVLYSYRMGGSEILASRLARALQRRNMAVSTCSLHTEKGVISDELEAAGIPCKSFDLEHRSRFSKLFFQIQLFWYLKKHRFDVMHVHHIFVLRHCYYAARLAGIRHIVVTEHSDHEFREHAGLRKDGNRFGNLADKVTVIHGGMKKYFEQDLSVDAGNIQLVYNSVDTRIFHPGSSRIDLRKMLGLSPDHVICGWVGRFHAAKDIETLMRAFQQVVATAGKPVALVMVGDGVERDKAVALVNRLEIQDKVHFLGSRQDIPDLMRCFDLYVSSSEREGVPLVLLEAMATGLPCVATNVGGVADIIGSETGRVVPSKHPELLANALQELIDDDELRQQLGERAVIEVERKFRFEAMVDEFSRVLKVDDPLQVVADSIP